MHYRRYFAPRPNIQYPFSWHFVKGRQHSHTAKHVACRTRLFHLLPATLTLNTVIGGFIIAIIVPIAPPSSTNWVIDFILSILLILSVFLSVNLFSTHGVIRPFITGFKVWRFQGFTEAPHQNQILLLKQWIKESMNFFIAIHQEVWPHLPDCKKEKLQSSDNSLSQVSDLLLAHSLTLCTGWHQANDTSNQALSLASYTTWSFHGWSFHEHVSTFSKPLPNSRWPRVQE